MDLSVQVLVRRHLRSADPWISEDGLLWQGLEEGAVKRCPVCDTPYEERSQFKVVFSYCVT